MRTLADVLVGLLPIGAVTLLWAMWLHRVRDDRADRREQERDALNIAAIARLKAARDQGAEAEARVMTGESESRRPIPTGFLWRDQRGQDLIEYALLAGLIAVAVGIVLPGVASAVSTIFSGVSSTLNAAANGS
jgi:Flp pilus assembly pilin Flp